MLNIAWNFQSVDDLSSFSPASGLSCRSSPVADSARTHLNVAAEQHKHIIKMLFMNTYICIRHSAFGCLEAERLGDFSLCV